MPPLLAEDLDHVLTLTRDLWEEVRGGRLFLTGGTGFFGKWLVESFCHANAQLKLQASLLVLSRDPRSFRSAMPHLAQRTDVAFHVGDVCDFASPPGHFSHVIHAATPTTGSLESGEQLKLARTIAGGTLRVLDFARACGAKKLLLTSSGAIYGPQPSDMTHLPEEYPGAPCTMDVRATYGHCKRLAEHYCALYHASYGIETKIARCFAFVGPWLPLDAHFAIGNFIRDGLAGGPIIVQGDGAPFRSYLHAADLTAWLWTILFRGRACHPYNVGSDQQLSIAELAERVAAAFDPSPPVSIQRSPTPGTPARHYVPAIQRARSELGLQVHIDLDEAISRSLTWLRRC